jgi:hypothetical protein
VPVAIFDSWYVHYEQQSPSAFTDLTTGGVTWHCLFGSLFAERNIPPEYTDYYISDSDGRGQLRYEVLPLVSDSLVYDPSTIVIYEGTCDLQPSEIVEEVKNFVNFTTDTVGCNIGTSPFTEFP